MPKHELDSEDPLELRATTLVTEEDTTREMAECFIEEFLRLGSSAHQVLALFRNPHYAGPHLAWEKHGELFVRGLIAEVFSRWGRPLTKPEPPGIRPEPTPNHPSNLSGL